MSDIVIETSAWDLIFSKAQSAASRLRVRSALNPMLWLCGIVSVPCFAIAYFTRETEQFAVLFIVIGAIPIAATILGFFYFMIVSPDKLQSEEYQLRHEALELIRQKGKSVAVSPSSLEAITNPVRLLQQGDQR